MFMFYIYKTFSKISGRNLRIIIWPKTKISRNRTKIDQELACQTCKFLMFWKKKQYPGKFRCLNTTPELLASDVSLFLHLPITTIKTLKRSSLLWKWRMFWHTSARVAVWHAASLAQNLRATQRSSDWSTRYFDESNWLNVLCHWLTRFAWLFKSTKVGQKSIFEWALLDAPVLGQYLSDFIRVKTNVQAVYLNISTGIFWLIYPLKLVFNILVIHL